MPVEALGKARGSSMARHYDPEKPIRIHSTVSQREMERLRRRAARENSSISRMLQNSVRELLSVRSKNVAKNIPRAPKAKMRVDDTSIVIRDRSQVILYSRIVISALQEAIDYDPLRQHNQTPPDLWSENSQYIEELRKLVAELRRLNSLLETTTKKPRTARTVVNLGKHFDKFFQSYASALGKGAGWLTIGLVASLLYQAGLGNEAVGRILSHLKLAA
jgi:hypothetical protein